MLRPQQLAQIGGHMARQLAVQPLKRFDPMQLIQTSPAEQITGEVGAIAEFWMGKHITVKSDQLGLHRCRHIRIGGEIHLQYRGWEKPVERHDVAQTIRSSSPWSTPLRRHQATTVFTSNIVTVIGPTPPGTGDRADAIGSTSSATTSPHSPPSGLR